MTRRGDRAWQLASRTVQIGFLLGLLVLWYLATNFWGVNHLLLPNPVDVWEQFMDVLRSGAFLPDLALLCGTLGRVSLCAKLHAEAVRAFA